MHLLNINGLKRDLIADRVTNYEIAAYLFLTGGGGFPIWYFDERHQKFSPWPYFLDLAASAAYLVTAYFGYRACYYVNGGLSGPRFADRFVSIAFVVGLRFSLALIPLIWAAIWLVEIDNERLFSIPLMVIEILFFWRVHSHLRDISEQDRAPHNQPMQTDDSWSRPPHAAPTSTLRPSGSA